MKLGTASKTSFKVTFFYMQKSSRVKTSLITFANCLRAGSRGIFTLEYQQQVKAIVGSRCCKKGRTEKKFSIFILNQARSFLQPSINLPLLFLPLFSKPIVLGMMPRLDKIIPGLISHSLLFLFSPPVSPDFWNDEDSAKKETDFQRGLIIF